MRCLVIAELENGAVSHATRVTINAAHQLGEVDLLVPCAKAVASASHIQKVARVLQAEHTNFANPVSEDLAALTLSLRENYDAFLAPANSFGKNFLPRVAAKLDVAQISDITQIVSKDTFVRPIYAGNAFITVKSSDPKKVISVRITAFEASNAEGGSAPIETLSFEPPSVRSSFVSAQIHSTDRPDLSSAKIVISGGRGLKSKENFQIIEQLADRLGAAVGASRAAVDAGFVPNDYQVGQTGKVVAPDLYFAIGISGAIQHLAGIKDSKVIVAINKDPDAPIFEVADYGLAADFFSVLPELEAALDQLGYHKK